MRGEGEGRQTVLNTLHGEPFVFLRTCAIHNASSRMTL